MDGSVNFECSFGAWMVEKSGINNYVLRECSTVHEKYF